MLLNMLVILVSAGCGSVSVEPLMPTPVLFTTGEFAPLDHIPEHERWVPRRGYYATDRARTANVQEIAYGNTPSDDVSGGMALIGFGGPSMTWSDLDRKSRMKDRDITSNNEALVASRRIMGGGARIGEQAQQLTEEQRELVLRQDRLEVVDVSRESESRGFDITGHRYWSNHPWASTDVLLAIRTDLEPEERGLEQSDSPVVWLVPADYPQRLNDALDRPAFKRSWGEYND